MICFSVSSSFLGKKIIACTLGHDLALGTFLMLLLHWSIADLILTLLNIFLLNFGATFYLKSSFPQI